VVLAPTRAKSVSMATYEPNAKGATVKFKRDHRYLLTIKKGQHLLQNENKVGIKSIPATWGFQNRQLGVKPGQYPDAAAYDLQLEVAN
jgi:hypothetical protein